MKNVGNSSRGCCQESRKFSRHPCRPYRAHCAVIFAIAQLSCTSISRIQRPLSSGLLQSSPWWWWWWWLALVAYLFSVTLASKYGGLSSVICLHRIWCCWTLILTCFHTATVYYSYHRKCSFALYFAPLLHFVISIVNFLGDCFGSTVITHDLWDWRLWFLIKIVETDSVVFLKFINTSMSFCSSWIWLCLAVWSVLSCACITVCNLQPTLLLISAWWLHNLFHCMVQRLQRCDMIFASAFHIFYLYFCLTHWLRYRQVASPDTVPSSLDGTLASRLRYRILDGYDAVNTISFSLSATRLVLTPALTLNDPLGQNFTTKWRGHFKTTGSGNGNVYANYHR